MKSSIVWLAGLLLSLNATAHADVQYTITDLGTLGGATSSANAINNNGQVVGQAALSDGSTHAFLYNGGPLIDLGTLGGASSIAKDINDSGTIVGASATALGTQQAFVFSNGVMSALQTFPQSTSSTANAINKFGQIAGTANSADSVNYPEASLGQAFIYDSGTAKPISIPFTYKSFGSGINANGEVAGTWVDGPAAHSSLAFRYNTVTTLVPLGQLYNGVAINDRGDIVGYSGLDEDIAIWHEDGTVASMGVSFHIPYSVNNLGEIVGLDLTTSEQAFIYSGGALSDLNSLVSPTSGWSLKEAFDINDAGQIVGSGTNPDGQTHAYLLTPTPEPAGALLAAVASFLLTQRRRARKVPLGAIGTVHTSYTRSRGDAAGRAVRR